MEDPSKWVYKPENFNYNIAMHEDQRINNGFSDYDAFNGDNYLAWVIVGICKNLKNGHGFPAELGNDGWDEWMAILDEMIEGFEAHNKDVWVLGDSAEANRDRLQEQFKKTDRALELFRKYFASLWD